MRRRIGMMSRPICIEGISLLPVSSTIIWLWDTSLVLQGVWNQPMIMCGNLGRHLLVYNLV